MRLIDADVALAAVKPYEPNDEMWSVTGGTAIRLICRAIDNTPTVDAVPVVRCRECTHYNGHRHCDYFYQAVLDDDFCSYGEKKRPTNSAPLNQEERWLKTV